MASLPRIVFVGGAPLAGKSSLAQAAAHRLGVAHISTDDLSVAIQAVTTEESHPALHRDGLFRDTYQGQDAERLLEDAVAVHREAWPAIEAVATAHATRDGPAVIEGWGILPEYVAGLALEGTGAVFVVPDEEVFEHRCRADAAFYQGEPDEEGLIRSFAQRSVLFSRQLDASAKKLGLPVVRPTLQTSLEETVAHVLNLLADLRS